MAFTKKYYYSHNRLEASEFDRALAFTKTRENTQAIARSYLVEHNSLDVITERYAITKQNVFRATKKMLEDAATAQQMIDAIKPVYRKLPVPERTRELAHPFFFSTKTIQEVASTLQVDPQEILDAARAVVRKYNWYADKDVIKSKEQSFKKILPFARAGEKSIQIAYDHLVLGEALVDVARKHEVTKQNAYNILRRFDEAKKRYEAEEADKAKK